MRLMTPYFTSRSLNSNLFDEMERWFDLPEQRGEFAPGFEIVEDQDKYTISVDLPGLKKDQIQVEMNDDLLTIAGERKRELAAEGKSKTYLVERSFGTFSRSFRLPRQVNGEGIKATFEDGVLSLEVPKAPEAKAKTIQIQ